LESLFGSQEAVAGRLVQRAAECGLAIRVAAAANIEVALVAVRGFTGITIVPPGAENKILQGLPVQALSPPPEILEILQRWGVHTCGALAALPLLDLSERLGQAGVRLHARACGTFTRELVVAEPAHHFEEQWELDEAVEDLDALSFCLGRLLDQVCARLAARSLAVASLRISFELQPAFDKAFDAARESFRQKSEPGLYQTVLQVPFATRDSKMLLKLLRLRLQAQPPSAAVTKIFLFVESGRAPVTQNSLFLPIAPEPDKLELTLARIRGIVGEANAGSAMLADSHRPGAFRMVPFAAASFRPAAHSHSASVAVEPHQPLKTPAMFRMFRPPLPATVHLQEETPSRIVFQGKRGMVLMASGPWRSSGDWWEREAWARDEWDIALQNADGVVLYRLVHDLLGGGWFVEGTYD